MYCINCGNYLPGEYNKCSVCKSGAAGDKLYCPECGSGNSKKAPRCTDCETKLYFPPELIRTAPRPQQKKRKTAAVYAFLLGFAGAHEYYLGFRKKAVSHTVWFVASIAVSFISWLILINQFNKSIVDGAFVAEKADSMVGGWIVIIVIIVAALLMALASWVRAIIDGILILRNPAYRDAENQLLD